MNPPDQLQSKALSNGYGKTGHDFRPMTEYEFWFQKQLLEEALLRVRINETGNKDPYQDFWRKSILTILYTIISVFAAAGSFLQTRPTTDYYTCTTKKYKPLLILRRILLKYRLISPT